VSQKNPLRFCGNFFQKRLGIFWPNFIGLLCVPVYARLRIFIQLSATLTKLCHIKRDHPVHIMCAKCLPCIGRNARWHFLAFFPLGIFSPNFTRLLSVHIYARTQIFSQLSYLQLCHIKCDHPACVSVQGRNQTSIQEEANLDFAENRLTKFRVFFHPAVFCRDNDACRFERVTKHY